MSVHTADTTQAGPEALQSSGSRRPADAPSRSSDTSPSAQPDRHSPAGGREADGQRSVAEWVTLAMSSLIVLGLFGLTSYMYLTGSTGPAAIEVEPRLSDAYQAGGRFYLPITMRNTGSEPGEEVRVRVSLTDGSGRQETADVMVQFLAGGDARRAVVAFGSDPSQGQIEAVVTSYLEP